MPPGRLRTAFALLLAAALLPGCQRSGKNRAPDDAAAPTQPGPAWRPGYRRPPVIDVHAHIHPSGRERLARIMADSGLALVVNLSGGSTGPAIEASVALSRRLAPPPGSAARIAVVHFYDPYWPARNSEGFGATEAARLEAAVKQVGFRGLKIDKSLGLYLTDAEGKRIPVDWPELDPLWQKAGELGVPVAIHTGDPKAFWQPVTPDNERYAELSVHPSWSFAGPEWPSRETLLAERERVIARHPDTTFLCVHFGNDPEDLDYVSHLLDTYPNVVIDTAARLAEIGRHPPEQVRAFFVKYQDRILFGTDLGVSDDSLMLGSNGAVPPTMDDVAPFYAAHFRFFEGKERAIPHPSPIQGDWTIDAIDLPDPVLDKLYRGNAERILGLRGVPDRVTPAAKTPARAP